MLEGMLPEALSPAGGPRDALPAFVARLSTAAVVKDSKGVRSGRVTSASRGCRVSFGVRLGRGWSKGPVCARRPAWVGEAAGTDPRPPAGLRGRLPAPGGRCWGPIERGAGVALQRAAASRSLLRRRRRLLPCVDFPFFSRCLNSRCCVRAGIVEGTFQVLTSSLVVTLGGRRCCHVSSPPSRFFNVEREGQVTSQGQAAASQGQAVVGRASGLSGSGVRLRGVSLTATTPEGTSLPGISSSTFRTSVVLGF